MAKAVFLSSTKIDASTLTTDSEVATLPVTNLQQVEPERVWRSESHTPRVVINLAESIAINSAVVIAHNGVATAQFRVQVGNTEASVTGGTPVADSGLISMWPVSGKPVDSGLPHLSSLALFSNDTPVTWVSITFSDPDNADNFEAGRIMVDRASRIKIGSQIGLQVSTISDLRTTDFNRIFGDPRGPNSRKMLIPLNAVDKDDFRSIVFKYQLVHGKVLDFFFCADPDKDADFALYSMQAVFGDMSSFARQLMYNSNGAMWAGVLPLLEQT